MSSKKLKKVESNNKKKSRKDKELDRDLSNTFPASDPITKY